MLRVIVLTAAAQRRRPEGVARWRAAGRKLAGCAAAAVAKICLSPALYDMIRRSTPLFAALTILLATTGLASCSNEPTNPIDVATEFFERLGRADFSSAANLAQEQSAAFLQLVQEMVNAQEFTGEFLTLPQGGELLSLDPIQLGAESLQVSVKRGDKEELVTLVYEGGAWKVRLPESLF